MADRRDHRRRIEPPVDLGGPAPPAAAAGARSAKPIRPICRVDSGTMTRRTTFSEVSGPSTWPCSATPDTHRSMPRSPILSVRPATTVLCRRPRRSRRERSPRCGPVSSIRARAGLSRASGASRSQECDLKRARAEFDNAFRLDPNLVEPLRLVGTGLELLGAARRGDRAPQAGPAARSGFAPALRCSSDLYSSAGEYPSEHRREPCCPRARSSSAHGALLSRRVPVLDRAERRSAREPADGRP